MDKTQVQKWREEGEKLDPLDLTEGMNKVYEDAKKYGKIFCLW